jgi:hypothetical protein
VRPQARLRLDLQLGGSELFYCNRNGESRISDRGDKNENLSGDSLGFVQVLVLGMQGQNMPMQTMSGILGPVRTIPLPTEGYRDHLAVDVKVQRLFICGEAKRSLEVVDLRAGKVIHSTTGLSGNPGKPFYFPETNEVWVDLGDGTVVANSGTRYEQIKSIALPRHGDPKRVPDNGAYDPAGHLSTRLSRSTSHGIRYVAMNRPLSRGTTRHRFFLPLDRNLMPPRCLVGSQTTPPF